MKNYRLIKPLTLFLGMGFLALTSCANLTNDVPKPRDTAESPYWNYYSTAWYEHEYTKTLASIANQK